MRSATGCLALRGPGNGSPARTGGQPVIRQKCQKGDRVRPTAQEGAIQWCRTSVHTAAGQTQRRLHAGPGIGREPQVGVVARIRAVVHALLPVDPEFAAALARRWAGLPETARTPGQVLGRHAVGCEGTHGVFPRCNLACTPCYHSRDANRVRVDGRHTLAQVQAQMGLLRRARGRGRTPS